MADQFGDCTFGVEDALSLDLGRVRGQHRRDIRLRQHLGDLAGADVGAGQALEGHCQRAFLQMALGLVVFTAAHMVAILGDVGQVAEVAEGTNHAHRLVTGEVLQQAVEHASGRGVPLQPVGHRELAHALDQLEGLGALLLADHVAEDAAEQANVVHQGPVLGRSIVAALGCHTARL
jgi:hypothetical protein